MDELKIGEIKEASTIDYPGEMVSVIFFCYCPFRCPFCQNWSLVFGNECTNMSVEEIIKEVLKYRKYITGICITGGEPTVQIEGLIKLLKETHKQGLLNKIDTNGFYPIRIKDLLSFELIDYAAVDIKAPFISKRYGKMIGNLQMGADAVKNVKETIKLLKEFSISFETRTTIIPTHNESEQEIELIAKQLRELSVSRYILQQFRATGGTLDESFSKLPATNYIILNKLANLAKRFIPDVRTRTIEAGEKRF
ncbi:MAG: anaerobic ribonucleoside-triphosphate reductase activating protein [Promethearchaeota archaeon]